MFIYNNVQLDMIANWCLVIQYRLNYKELVPSNSRFPDHRIKCFKKNDNFYYYHENLWNLQLQVLLMPMRPVS